MKNLALLIGIAGILGGCTATIGPRPMVLVRPAEQVVVQQDIVEEIDYVGEGTPLVITGYAEPFYPRYVIGCDCIIPLAFIGGFWINGYSGAHVVHDGHWRSPPAHIRNAHREMIRSHPERFHRMNAPNGRPGGHPAQQHVTPQHVPAQHPTQPQHQPQARPPVHTQPQHAPQARPQQVRPQRAPQARPQPKAPAKKCPQDHKC